MQKRMHSLAESVASTMAGFLVSVLAWEWIVKPVWHIETTMVENIQITALFTVLSIARGYVMRRIGNAVSARELGASRGWHKPPRPMPRPNAFERMAADLERVGSTQAARASGARSAAGGRPCEHVWLQQLAMPHDPPAPRYRCSKCGSVWICGV